jgi:hypothetical protein
MGLMRQGACTHATQARKRRLKLCIGMGTHIKAPVRLPTENGRSAGARATQRGSSHTRALLDDGHRARQLGRRERSYQFNRYSLVTCVTSIWLW